MHNDFFKGKRNHKDDLTKVYNREIVLSYADYLIEHKIPFVFGIIDIDNFKYVNDNYGHSVGDIVLQEFATHTNSIPNLDFVFGRFGGDEFLIIIEGITEYQDEWQALHTILKSTKTIHFEDMPEIQLTMTIGAARYPLDGDNIDRIMELSDKALYRGKMKGRNCFIIYLPEKHANIDLKSEREKAFSPMYLTNRVYQLLTVSKYIEKGIKACMDYLGSYLMIDHLCLEDDNKLYFEYFHPLCKQRDFFPVKKELIDSTINETTGLCYENIISPDKPYAEVMKQQNIISTFYCEIKLYGYFYGYLRADIVGPCDGRIWQNQDMALLMSATQCLALLLYINERDLPDLDEDI